MRSELDIGGFGVVRVGQRAGPTTVAVTTRSESLGIASLAIDLVLVLSHRRRVEPFVAALCIAQKALFVVHTLIERREPY